MKAFRGRIICVSMIGSSDILRYPERGTYEGFSRSYHMCLDDRLICPRTHINTQTHTFFFADGRCGILHGLALGLSGTTLPEAEHTNEITPRPRASTHAKSPRPHPRRTSTHVRAPSSITFVRHRTQGTARRYQYRSQAVSQDEKRFNYLISEGHRGGCWLCVAGVNYRPHGVRRVPLRLAGVGSTTTLPPQRGPSEISLRRSNYFQTPPL